MNYINTTTSDFLLQKTVKRKIHFSGVGVHSGRAVSMSLEPAESDTGIVFERTDLKNNNFIKIRTKRFFKIRTFKYIIG